MDFILVEQKKSELHFVAAEMEPGIEAFLVALVARR